MPEIQQTAEVAVIKNALPTLTNLPQILTLAQTSALNGVNAANQLLLQCDAEENPSAETDQRAAEMILKINKTVEKMEERRKPGTQMMAEIAKLFTVEENKLKAPLEKLRIFRNRRATWVVNENKRLEEEARQLALKNTEKANVTAYYLRVIAGCLNKKLADRKMELTANFDSLTLADYEVRAEKLRSLMNSFPSHKLNVILVYNPASINYLTAEERTQIHDKIIAEYDFDGFYAVYNDELDELKRSLVDRLPSKLTELQESKRIADEQERQRQENERLKQQQAQEQDEKRRQQLEQQRKDNQRRQQELKQEQQEQERQRQERERLEQQRLQQESQQRQKESEVQVDVQQAGMVGGTLFDAINIAGQKEAEGETRKSWEITVVHMAGWAELFQFWYLAKAASTPLDKFGAMKLDQIKAYAESVGDTEKIKSPYLKYEEKIVAINRKKTTNAKP